MIRRFTFGAPFATEAAVKEIEPCNHALPYFTQEQNYFSLKMEDDDIVYGLGQNVRGINKRGFLYESFCTDEFEHDENKHSLYGAHNFLIVSGKTHLFGVFFDTPGKITFDIGYTEFSSLKIEVENDGYNVYLIENPTLDSIAEEFRSLIGQSYIPPKWSFGIGQSRWGYRTEDDIRKVAEGYRSSGIPLDMIYLDIDYMEQYKDFTVSKEAFPEFKKLVQELKESGIRIIPIIDAAVKAEDGFELYEEGKRNGYFCKDENGNDFTAGVWPGKCCLPDFLNPEARRWFGSKYKILLDLGIEGFWNDMNEPALFYSEKNLKSSLEKICAMKNDDIGLKENFALKDIVKGLANSRDDYKSFYHNADGKTVSHYSVHNLYGGSMTRAAAEAFASLSPQKRVLLFSRASCIGAHRYGGIWMGDNKSQWAHLLMNLKMLPSLNMCGFLFTGADVGGFGENATEDLLLRWYALGIFMPLLRNHSAMGTRSQEPYQFTGSVKKCAGILNLRYRLLPYLYSEFMKAALKGSMYARPLGFLWPDDEDARRTEDQLMIGESIMICPVYEQNAAGRHVYLPEEMKLVRFRDCALAEETVLPAGHTFISVALDEVVFFIRKGHLVPLAEKAGSVEYVDFGKLTLLHFASHGSSYELYDDDGESRSFSLDGHIRTLTY